MACDIPEEKKELYERSGWHVVGDYNSDLVVVCTDDPDAPEIYTDPELLVKPLKKISSKLLASWLIFWLLSGWLNYVKMNKKTKRIRILSCSMNMATSRF